MNVVERPRNVAILLFILVMAFILRLSPYLVSGVPYHTDSWTMFPIVDTLLERTPVPLRPEMGFDNYNIYWPGLPLFAVLLSNVVGIKPISLLPVVSPLVSSFSILVLYAFLRRMGSSSSCSLAASLLFGLAGGETVLTAGITKEGYALPLFLLVLFLLARGMRDGAKFSLLVLAVIPSLILSHHLTSVAALVLSAYLLLSHLLYPETRGSSLLLSAFIILAFALSLLAYFSFHAQRALPFRLSETDVISLTAYQIVLFLPFVLSPSLLRSPSLWVRRWIKLSLALTFGLILAALKLQIMVGAPTISIIDLLLLSPYLGAALLAVFGAEPLEKAWGRGGMAFIGMWIFGLLAVELYIIFGTPGLPSNAYRLGNFLFMGVLILASSRWLNFRSSFAGTLFLVLIAGGMAFTLPYTSFLSGPLGGSQRVYSVHDVVQARWIVQRSQGVKVHGDIRLSYLLYNRMNVSVYGPLPFLMGEGKPPEGCIVLTDLMKEIGYIAYTQGIALDPLVLGSIYSNERLSLVYSSGRNLIFFV